MSPRERWHTQGSTRIILTVREGQWRNIIKMDTDHKRPRYTFYIFSFSCEAVVLLISLKLDSLNPSCYTHTHLRNGQVIESSHNNYIFLFVQGVHHIWCCCIPLWGKYNGKDRIYINLDWLPSIHVNNSMK